MHVSRYLGALDWQTAQGAIPWSQEKVNVLWEHFNLPAPAPLVPMSLVGWKQYIARDPTKLTKDGKNRKRTQEETDFMNFFGKVMDQFHKQSGISKVAGGILKVASIAIPTFGIVSAVGAGGNVALAKANENAQQNLAEKVLTPALEAQAASEAARQDALTQASLDALRAIPTSGPKISFSATSGSTPKSAPSATGPSATGLPMSTNALILFAAVGLSLFLVMRK